jgi:hypothetical protein
VSANAYDNVGVVGVQFKLDGSNLGSEDTAAPYSISWNTTLASLGTRALTAVARDAAGNTVTSAAVNVVVDRNMAACPPPPPPTPSTPTVNFGGHSMRTTSFGQTFQLTNGGAGNLTITGISVTAGFSIVGHNCSTLSSGASCNVTVNFTPTTQGTASGTITITNSAGTSTMNAIGVGERSLVTHYYHAILNREPDSGGKVYWDGEAARMTSLGANINETWFVMAGNFFNSPEYQSAGKNNAQFVTDLYNTFFNRVPDSGGFNFWMGQIAGGLPREVVLISFMFSPEFRTFAEAIFGNTAARPEVDMVVDFFRGILSRLPETAGFNYWVGQLKTAQCKGPGAVYAKVHEISNAFIFSPEYSGRGRNNTQYVTDMYNSFLRRGADAGGVNFWINQLNTGAKDRNTVRTDFIASPEFSARVNAVMSAGCSP